MWAVVMFVSFGNAGYVANRAGAEVLGTGRRSWCLCRWIGSRVGMLKNICGRGIDPPHVGNHSWVHDCVTVACERKHQGRG